MRSRIPLIAAALTLLALLGIAGQAHALACNYYPFNICLQCCEDRFEACLAACDQHPNPGCEFPCFLEQSSCHSSCIYAPRVGGGSEEAETAGSVAMNDSQFADLLARRADG